jgi:hypothetical protein
MTLKKSDLSRFHVIEIPGLLHQTSDSLDAESDLLPEFSHYQDEGCDLAPSCLDCPFTECKEDQPHGRDKLSKKDRNAEIVRLHLVKKKSLQYLADKFHLDRRTIITIVQASRSGKSAK